MKECIHLRSLSRCANHWSFLQLQGFSFDQKVFGSKVATTISLNQKKPQFLITILEKVVCAGLVTCCIKFSTASIYILIDLICIVEYQLFKKFNYGKICNIWWGYLGTQKFQLFLLMGCCCIDSIAFAMGESFLSLLLIEVSGRHFNTISSDGLVVIVMEGNVAIPNPCSACVVVQNILDEVLLISWVNLMMFSEYVWPI